MPQNLKTDSAPLDVESLPDLTEKQAAFVSGLLSGLSATEAYRQAYDASGMAPNTIWARASELRHDGKVQVWLTAAKIAGLSRAGQTLEEYVAELDGLKEEARLAGNYGAAANLQVAKGKARGFYVDRHMDLTDRRQTDVEALALAVDPTRGAAYHAILDAIPQRPKGATVQ